MNVAFLKETSRGLERFTAADELLKHRKVFFTEEVTPESSNELIQYLLCLEQQDEKTPVTVYINSPGGEVVSGLAAYDTMRTLKCQVNTVCIGTAASMGSILFLAGEKRAMLPHTKIMIHDPLISGLSGSRKALELEKEAKQLLETREITGRIIAERSGHKLREVYAKTKEDCFLTAEEALDFGIATEIVDRL
ncbi:MAG: ATP-dependent Clp protease proteolytic subunit [Lachnospiraceae bacterium]|nr:ATP-dependent Clp protease proteolytic subunit [Lachnospiraceae bacterium]